MKHLPEDVLLEIEQVISPEDVKQIDGFADHVRTSMPENFESRIFSDDPKNGGNNVTYMNQIFKERIPKIYSNIIELSNEEIVRNKWDPQIKGKLGVRCIERLEYNTGSFLDWHEDHDSIYTLILSLSQSGTDYEGGEFKLKLDHSEIVSHTANMGSGFIFRSECSHAVAPVSKGTRTVLVLEFWEFQDSSRYDLRPGTEYGVPFETG